MVEKLNEFQLAVVRILASDHMTAAETASDAKRFLSKLKKDKNSGFVVAVLEELGKADNVSDAASRLIQIEIELKHALSAIGAISMQKAGERRKDAVSIVEVDEATLQPALIGF